MPTPETLVGGVAGRSARYGGLATTRVRVASCTTTGGLGRAATLAMADRPDAQRPDLLLAGRAGPELSEYAHELQRRAGAGINVTVFEPGWMPGTALSRGAPAAMQVIGRGIGHLPGVSTPQHSGPALASIAIDDTWAHLRDGAFVVKDKVTEVQPVATDRDRERRLWAATTELLGQAR